MEDERLISEHDRQLRRRHDSKLERPLDLAADAIRVAYERGLSDGTADAMGLLRHIRDAPEPLYRGLCRGTVNEVMDLLSRQADRDGIR